MLPSEGEIRAFLSGPVKKSGVHLICTCWNCNKELHYFYNVTNGLSDCKKCGVSANLYKFLAAWGQLHLLEGSQVRFEAIKTLAEQMPGQEPLDLTMADFKLPVGFTKLKWNSPNKYTAYLKSRKYTEQDFEIYGPGYTSLVDKYDEYVIIPLQRDYSVKGFVARYIKDDDLKPRYQNSKSTKFTKLLDGFDQITSNTETAIIVEGHFDKVSVNTELNLNNIEQYKALASFGKKFSAYQIELLRKTNIKNLYFFYDFTDAIAQIKRFGLQAKPYFNVYGCYANTTKDPGTMQAKQILAILQAAEPIAAYGLNKVQKGILR